MLNITKEELEKLYITDKKSINDIAKIYNCRRQTISDYLKKFDIDKVSRFDRVKDRVTKTVLYDLYITQNLTEEEIYKQLNISPSTISKLIKEYNLQKDGITYQSEKRIENQKILTKSFLESEYKNKSINIISEETGISQRVISDKMKEYGIEIKDQYDKDVMVRSFMYKYGVSNSSQLESVKEKRKQTNLQKYGVSSYSMTDEFKNTNKRRVIAQMNCDSNKTDEQINILNDKNLFEEYIKSLSKENRTLTYLSNNLGYNIKHIGKKLMQYGLHDLCDVKQNISQYESDIVSFIKSLGVTNIVRNDKSLIAPQEIDIYLPDYKVGIEFNGDYWHSDVFKTDHNGRSTYHQEKSLLAESKGIFLYHIFEYEWLDKDEQQKIKNHLRNILKANTNKSIYARKCEIKLINSKQKKAFLDLNHLQGNCPSSINIGLFYNNDLVSVMCFSSNTSGDYTYELCRFCSIRNTNVVGGASKLFKYFIDNYVKSNETIVSYSNITKTTGKLYGILNFKMDHISTPNYVWVNLNNRDVKTRYQTKMKNENETMHNMNYVKVCDCGTKVWIYTKD